MCEGVKSIILYIYKHFHFSPEKKLPTFEGNIK